ncbi:MAG TPA: hypothetical protein VH413_10825 [Verrucomicrobiae bacterium]|jgi:hypothetical protein|nr:hypothetical protein [Verrucomicrobiae bacterium]
MKQPDEPLNRLFKAAAAASTPAPGAARFAVEARVLGAWRGLAQNDGAQYLVAWFRRAALCGFAIALLTVAWNLQHPNRSGAELAVAESAMGMGVEP